MYHVGEPARGSNPSENPSVTAAADRAISPIEIIARRKFLIALCAILMAVASVAIGSLFAPRYTATTQLLIDPSELQVVDRGLRSSSQLNDALIAEVESQTRVLLSNKVLQRVITNERLDQDEEFTSNVALNPIDHLRNLLTAVGLRSEENTGPPNPALDALRALRDRVWAQRQERTFVVDLGVWTSDRQKSVRIADAIVEAFLQEQLAANANAARQASASLGGRLDGLRQRVIDAEKAVEDYKRRNKILSSSGELVDEQQLTAVSGQLIQARTRRSEAEARYRQIEQIRRSGGDIGAIPEAIASQTLAALRGQFAAAQRREAELSAQLLPRHPVVRQAREEVQRLKREIDAETGRIASSIRRELQRAEDSEKSLTSTLDGMKGQLTGINAKRVELRELERDVEAQRKVYESFLLRTQEIAEQEKLELPKARVISPAMPPEHKSLPPPKALLALAGLITGAGLGAALALVLHFANLLPVGRAGSTRPSRPARVATPSDEIPAPAYARGREQESRVPDRTVEKPSTAEHETNTEHARGSAPEPAPLSRAHRTPTRPATIASGQPSGMAREEDDSPFAAFVAPPRAEATDSPRSLFRRSPRLKGSQPDSDASGSSAASKEPPTNGPQPAWL